MGNRVGRRAQPYPNPPPYNGGYGPNYPPGRSPYQPRYPNQCHAYPPPRRYY